MGSSASAAHPSSSSGSSSSKSRPGSFCDTCRPPTDLGRCCRASLNRPAAVVNRRSERHAQRMLDLGFGTRQAPARGHFCRLDERLRSIRPQRYARATDETAISQSRRPRVLRRQGPAVSRRSDEHPEWRRPGDPTAGGRDHLSAGHQRDRCSSTGATQDAAPPARRAAPLTHTTRSARMTACSRLIRAIGAATATIGVTACARRSLR
jgi:hypothetical protein